LATGESHVRIFVTGGTGLVGHRLVRQFVQRGDAVVALTRRPEAARERLGSGVTIASGDPMQPGAWLDAMAECDAVVHLAGENVFARRWTAAFKELLRASRIQSTENVVQGLARQPRTASGEPKVLVNASAIGYYGPHGDEILDESSPPGDDFLAGACVDWEKAARAAEPHGVRVVVVRVGLVLDKEGGALKQMLTPFKLGVGGPVGRGRQWVSWIHHADLVGLLLLALDNAAARGPINGTAPNPVTNRDYSKALGRALHRPAFLPTPGFALRLALGQVARLATTGQRVLPRQAQALGYTFRFPTIDAALADILA
jgi:uncharacterized protein (TIGR01777 family)